MRTALVRWAPLLIPGVVAIAAVALLQVHGRGPLSFDEAARVEPGYRLAQLLAADRWGDAWSWVNEQTFHPFLTPALHGLALTAGLDAITAAWLPALLGYGLAGLLAARLAVVLGGGRLGATAAAVLLWSAPLEMRLAAGAFTEPLGICALLGVLLALARLQRAADRRGLVAAVLGAGLLTAIASWIAWDYGVAAALTVALSAAVLPGARRRVLAALGAGLVLAGALVAVDAAAKLAGASGYADQALIGSGGGGDLLYYVRQLLPGARQVDLSWVTGVLFIAGLALMTSQWGTRPAVRPLLVHTLALWALYSVAPVQSPRTVALLIAPLAVLGGIGLAGLATAVRGRVRRRRLASVTADSPWALRVRTAPSWRARLGAQASRWQLGAAARRFGVRAGLSAVIVGAVLTAAIALQAPAMGVRLPEQPGVVVQTGG